MTNRPENTLPLNGHALKNEGAPHNQDGVRLDHKGVPANLLYNTGATGTGRALCECGAMSGELPSRNKRSVWHRAHKMSIRTQAKES